MIRNRIFLFFALLLCVTASSYAQLWSGILPAGTAVNWSTAGISGGIPSASWTQSGSTIAATACGSGTTDCTSTIQAALNACGTAKNQYVLLGPGTFLLDGVLNIPSYCALRGSGANSTILSIHSKSSTAAITMGTFTANTIYDVKIASGATAGSTSIVVSSASKISAGTLLAIREYNDSTANVSTAGDAGGGVCTFCNVLYDGSNNSNRMLGQVDKVAAVSGTTVTLVDPIYRNMNVTLPNWAASTKYPYDGFITNGGHIYEQTVQPASPFVCTSGASAPAFSTSGGSVSDGTCTWLDMGAGTTTAPVANPMTPVVNAGLENLQIYANNTEAGSNWSMEQCDECWVSGVMGNYTDGDQGDIGLSYHVMIVNNYFSNAYLHTSGSFDSDLSLKYGSSGCLIQNNIFERLHVDLMMGEGASGNVIAYNYMLPSNYDTGALNVANSTTDVHEPHVEFNLYESNIGAFHAEDSTWGSNSDETSFREWLHGATLICNPTTAGGRGTAVCGPVGVQGNSGINGWWTTQANRAVQLHYQTSYFNLVGGVVGSQDMAKLTNGDAGVTTSPVVAEAIAGQTTLQYNSTNYELALGYGSTGDSGTSGFDSLLPYNTLFEHGEYSFKNASTTWSGSVTQTLPPSFYLSSKPSWFGSVPFPAIGPDVTGGLANAAGHAYAIPAEVCYESVMGGSSGTGSPFATFNAATCYPSGSGPAAPVVTGVVVH
jgi:hypothetical protein